MAAAVMVQNPPPPPPCSSHSRLSSHGQKVAVPGLTKLPCRQQMVPAHGVLPGTRGPPWDTGSSPTHGLLPAAGVSAPGAGLPFPPWAS